MIESDELREYVNAFQEAVNIMDTRLNTVAFNIYLTDLAKSEGVASFEEIETSDGTNINLFKSYEENDVRQVNIVVIDHIGLVKPITGQNERTMIIELADIMIKFRNRYKFTFIAIQQLNRSANSTDRHKLEDLLPKDSDFRGGSGLFDASDIVLGMMSPNRERQSTFMGYKIASSSAQAGLGNRFISLNIIKNRFGNTNVVVPLLFVGEIGLYEQLPVANDMEYGGLSKWRVHY